MDSEREKHEELVRVLCDPKTLEDYKKACDNHPVSFLPKVLGGFLIWAGNTLYGTKPTYLKFRAVEVIARVPYHSWTSAAHTLLTMFYRNEKKALELVQDADFARLSQENETMHVVVISHLAAAEHPGNTLTHTVIPMVFAFIYFWIGYLMYLVKPAWSLELNYLFENHAFEQYDRFLTENADMLKHKTVESAFLSWYGREHLTQHDFFTAVRNDELIHRNKSIRATDGE